MKNDIHHFNYGVFFQRHLKKHFIPTRDQMLDAWNAMQQENPHCDFKKFSDELRDFAEVTHRPLDNVEKVLARLQNDIAIVEQNPS